MSSLSVIKKAALVVHPGGRIIGCELRHVFAEEIVARDYPDFNAESVSGLDRLAARGNSVTSTS